MSNPLVNVVISDTHCGSDVGLMPPSFTTGAGNAITHGVNAHQSWLWQEFQSAWGQVQDVLNGDDFILTLNGDAIEGIHHRSTEMVSQKWEEHLGIATECLKPIAEQASDILVVKGTECHTANLEAALARELGSKHTAKDKWLYEVSGCLIDAAHHMGATSRAYLEASAYSIHMGNARQQYQRAGHRVPKVFLRGHRHVGGYFYDGYGIFAVTGAWQFLTRHGHKVVTDSIPSPTILVLDWRRVPQGGFPAITEIRSTPPQATIHEY